MTPQGLRDAIKKVTREKVGVELSPHKFRHLAAHRFLDAFPGHYEEVRQLLGHASLATTVRHYSGTESASCARRYDEVVIARRGQRRRPPAGPGTSSRRRPNSKGG